MSYTRRAVQRVSKLSSRFRHCVHGYHGVDPWDIPGQRLMYLGFDDLGQGSIVLRDRGSDEERVVAQTNEFDFHTAAGQRWVMNDSAILFRYGSHGAKAGTGVASADGAGQEVLDWLGGRYVRQVLEHGNEVIAVSGPGEDGACRVELIDLVQRRIVPIVTVDDLVAELPERLLLGHEAAVSYQIHHAVANGQRSRLFCKLMRQAEGQPLRFLAFFVIDMNPRAVRCLGDHISGHPFWMADGRHILNIKRPGDGSNNRWLVLVDAVSGADARLIDLPIEGPGHPSQSPDGTLVATDAFTADGRQCPIYLIDLATGSVTEAARLPHHYVGTTEYDATKIHRSQPHPVWAPCSRRLLLNCNNGGTHVSLVELELGSEE